MILLAITLSIHPQYKDPFSEANGGKCLTDHGAVTCPGPVVQWTGPQDAKAYVVRIPRGDPQDKSFTCYPDDGRNGVKEYDCVWNMLPTAGCLLFDKNNYPTEQVPCDDPRVKYPTSATVSLYKEGGTCISGACAVKFPDNPFPDNPKDGQCWMDGDNRYCFIYGSWQFHPQESGFGQCPPDQHFHAKGMDEDSPDVKGAQDPHGDQRCHKDSDDSVVEPRKVLGRKP